MNSERSAMLPERIHYLDVLKGLLIIVVVLEHIHYTTTSLCGFVDVGPSWKFFSMIENYAIVPFFMPCFFVVTGLCSNFEKEFTSFVKKNVLTMLWPSLVLTLSGMWFIWAMFFSKLIYWILNKYVRPPNVKFFVLLLLAFVGCLLDHSVFGNFLRKWYLSHAFGFCIFIYLGAYLKPFVLKKQYLFIPLLVYSIIVIACYVYGYKLPSLFLKYNVSLSEVPFHLLLAVSGSLGALFISKLIDRNFIIEFLGRNSLVIFLTHVEVMKLVVKFFPGVHSNLHSGFTYWIILLLTLLICSGLVFLLNSKSLKWLVGKFD